MDCLCGMMEVEYNTRLERLMQDPRKALALYKAQQKIYNHIIGELRAEVELLKDRLEGQQC